MSLLIAAFFLSVFSLLNHTDLVKEIPAYILYHIYNLCYYNQATEMGFLLSGVSK